MDADDVVFSTLSTSADVDRMVLFVQVTDDTDSWIVGYYQTRSGGQRVTPTGEDLIVPSTSNGYLSFQDPNPL
jgi:hypothetical protein